MHITVSSGWWGRGAFSFWTVHGFTGNFTACSVRSLEPSPPKHATVDKLALAQGRTTPAHALRYADLKRTKIGVVLCLADSGGGHITEHVEDTAAKPLEIPAAEDGSWPQFESGNSIATIHSTQYTILRKLGWGEHWAQCRPSGKGFVAIKALTGSRTKLCWPNGPHGEAPALAHVSADPASPHCVRLLDQFTIPGSGSAGSHLCFVFPVYGGSVLSLIMSRKASFEFPTARRIALHLLRGLAPRA
ncbi:Serine/threonine-protein kinase SRPK [Mycena sanguinolenta]|uniref:Serine/threonine-protein kinase SRPK n=1 Tax=Mycena sanguinolenta TaxID=230812 RepID=A0A8H6XXA9_9AGAR|nr:Serine/threonine-protein kinase SRPK [Mycena sanguinolenta]